MSPTTIIRQSAIGEGRPLPLLQLFTRAVAEMEVDFRAALPPEPFAVVCQSVGEGWPSINTLALATQDQVSVFIFSNPILIAENALPELLDVKFLQF